VTFITYRIFPATDEKDAMGLDQSKMGSVVAKQMEALEADYGDDCEIGDVCTIVEVIGPHGSHLRVRSSDMRPHITIGLLRASESMFLGGMRPGAAGGGEE
jgi:hypothetical protein